MADWRTHDRFARLREKVQEVVDELGELRLSIEEDIPSDLRYKLMVAACSINDYLLWIEEIDEEGDYGKRWRCNEIESGTHKDGDHVAEAIWHYFGAEAFTRVAEARQAPAEAQTANPATGGRSSTSSDDGREVT